jgi:hypothetical protein
MDGTGIRKKGKKKHTTSYGREERSNISPYILTGDVLCTVVDINGVYIVGVFYHRCQELSG